MSARCCKISKKTQLKRKQFIMKIQFFLYVGCMRGWPEKKSGTLLFYDFWALYDEWSRTHSKKFHAQKFVFLYPKGWAFLAFFRHFFNISKFECQCCWIFRSLDFRLSQLSWQHHYDPWEPNKPIEILLKQIDDAPIFVICSKIGYDLPCLIMYALHNITSVFAMNSMASTSIISLTTLIGPN